MTKQEQIDFLIQYGDIVNKLQDSFDGWYPNNAPHQFNITENNGKVEARAYVGRMIDQNGKAVDGVEIPSLSKHITDILNDKTRTKVVRDYIQLTKRVNEND